MRIIGFLLLVVGLAGLVFSLGMDTSVQVTDGARINNMGLMNEKQNRLIVFGVLSVVGAVLAAFGGRATSGQAASEPLGTESALTDRKCPHCAETIKAEARLCRFCQKEVDPLPTGSPSGMLADSVKECVAKLVASGCKVNRAEGGGWEVTGPTGQSSVATTVGKLELLVRKYESA